MKEIGGYFELETPYYNGHFHNNLLKLNTGRNALEYILKVKKYSKVYLPYFMCDVILEPFKKLNIAFQFYYIDKNLEAKFDYKIIKKNEAFLYINYFGIKDNYINSIASKNFNLIIDNTQAFFSLPIKNIDTFYSARKFFGVSDGAYLYTDKTLNLDLKQDISYQRISHLLKRIEYGAEYSYHDFIKNDDILINDDIKKMSILTDKILNSIPYKKYSEIRKNNFNYLHKKLSKLNKLKINDNLSSPLCYPLWIENGF